MAHITDVPETITGAGQGFDYTAPVALSRIELVNAPLDPEHRNIGASPAVYDTFIDGEVRAGRALVVDGLNLQSPDHDLDLAVDYETAGMFYNYGRLTIQGRKWFLFYTPQYLNKTSTRYIADLDEIASFDWQLGYSTIERGHVAVAASLNDPYGDRYLTTPEPAVAPPSRGVLQSELLPSGPDDWTVLVISANDLRGGTGNPFWDQHNYRSEIEGAARLASSATVDSAGTVQATIPNAEYPWAVGGSGTTTGPGSEIVDTVLPGHRVTNPGGTVESGWAWHMETAGRGGVDINYAYGTDLIAPVDGVVDELQIATVGMVTRLTLDNPVYRVGARQPSGDAEGPIYSIWFQHTSATYPGRVSRGQVIGKSGDGYGNYQPHLHIHALTDQSTVAGSNNRANFFAFVGATAPGDGSGSGSGPDVYVPKVSGSPVSTIDGISAGGGAYVFTPDGFAEYMTIMQGAPWITSGIIDVRLVPRWAVGGGVPSTFTARKSSTDPADPMWAEAAGLPTFVAEVTTALGTYAVLDGWRESALGAVGADGWRKLITSAFTEVIVGNGESVVGIVPENWPTTGMGFQASTGAAHGEQSIRVTPNGYNALDSQTGLSTPVGGKAGLAHSGYGIAASNTASQDLVPYLNAYSSKQSWAVALRNKSLAQQLGYNQIQLNAGVQGVQTVMGVAQSAAGGALVGGPAGAVAGAASGAIAAGGALATAGIQASNTITMLDASQNGSFDITAFQLALSGAAAVATFNAWKQSLSSVSGGGSAHHIASGWRAVLRQGFHVIVVMPTRDRVDALVSMWRRYGYMVGRAFRPQRLDCMTHFTYWQTDGAVILGAVPQSRRQTIAAAFDAGTTVWTDIAEIGTDVSGSNAPRSGIVY